MRAGRAGGRLQQDDDPDDTDDDDNDRYAVFDNPAALQTAVFNATASTTGYYCLRMYDNGSVAAALAAGSATSFTYTATVTHP